MDLIRIYLDDHQAEHLARWDRRRPKQARSFAHSRMKRAATQRNTTSPDLNAVVVAFADLQKKRHRADYVNGKAWTRIEVTARIRDAEAAFSK